MVDLAASYTLTGHAEVSARVENPGDETWVASRRTAGARPGMPRMAYVGMRLTF